MTEAQAVRTRTSQPLAAVRLERSDSVLWSVALPGAVLHNYRRARYIWIDESGYQLWAYLDGGRTTGEAVARVAAPLAGRARADLVDRLWKLVETLADNGFIVERSDDD